MQMTKHVYVKSSFSINYICIRQSGTPRKLSPTQLDSSIKVDYIRETDLCGQVDHYAKKLYVSLQYAKNPK